MRKVGCLLLVLGALVANHTTVFSAGSEEKAKFVMPPETVRGHKAVLKLEVAKDVFDKVDVFVAVRPSASPDTIWVQGAGVDVPKAEEIVNIGRENVATDVGKYLVIIVSFPKGEIKSDGPMKLATAKKIGMKILASVVIERVE